MSSTTERRVLDVGDGLTRGVGYSYILTSTGDNSCMYQWRLGNFLNTQAPYLETEDFVAGDYKWKLRLFPKVPHLDANYITVNLVSLNRADVTAHLVVAAINQRNVDDSRGSDGRFTFKPNEEHGFPCFQDRRAVVDPDSGFLHEGCYVIKALIEVIPAKIARGDLLHQKSVPSGATRTIHVALLTDELFKQRHDKMHPFGLVYLPDGGDLPTPASTELSWFATAVCSARGFDEASVRLWICDVGSDGRTRVQRPLRSRTSSGATTIGDLCTKERNATTEKLTLYLQISKATLPDLYTDSWILFCKVMDPVEKSLTYLTSITIRKSSTVLDLEKEARRLAHLPRNAESALVVPKEDLYPTGVDGSLTLANSGLRNGDVFWLCKVPPNSLLNMEQLHIWSLHLFCQSFGSLTLASEDDTSRQQNHTGRNEQRTRGRQEGQPVRQMANAVHAQMNNQRPPRADGTDRCVICWDNPRTSGFLHADSEAHLCACAECADAVMKTQNPRCPLCNQRITQMIKKLR